MYRADGESDEPSGQALATTKRQEGARRAAWGVIGDGDGDGDAIRLLIQGRAGYLQPFNSRKVARIRRRLSALGLVVTAKLNRSLLFPGFTSPSSSS